MSIADALRFRLCGVAAALQALWDWIGHPRWWSGTLWRWGHVIWVCRVPVIGAVGGGFLLAGAPQARDLFADLGMAWWQWVLFLVLVYGWAWAVHASARRALEQDEWVPEAHTEAGLDHASRARLRELFFVPALFVPRILGLSIFFFIGWAMCRTRLNLAPAPGLPEAATGVVITNWTIAGVVLAALAYVLWMWKPRTNGDWIARQPPYPPLLIGRAPIVSETLQAMRQAPAPPDALHALPPEASPPPPDAPRPPRRGIGILRVLVVLILLFGLVQPHIVASYLPRLFFAPLLFIAIVLLLGEVAAWAHRRRMPLLLVVVIVSAALLLIFDRFHDARWIDAETVRTPVMGPERQIGIATAVERWMAVNKCSGADCPRPIIIAGAGGASRAAFLTSTVVGALIDLGLDPRTEPRFGNLRNRIFALSTVSGSSAGALTIRAALADAAGRNTPNEPPCVHAASGSWFGYDGAKAREAGYDPKKSWRDCFQVILAGDFLTPVILGLGVRDIFPLGPFWTRQTWWDDRAALLEQGFERRYRRLTVAGNDPRSCGAPDSASAAEADDKAGLCRPFGYHPDPAKIGDAWLPLLFINGTSVAAGRRIIVGDVRAGDRFRVKPGTPEERRGTLLPLVHDLNEIRTWAPPSTLNVQAPVSGMNLNVQAHKPDDPRDKNRDIRLSTAATMSARFPLISPHGNLRDRTGDVVDRIVDGGYFENDGLATAADIVSALTTFGLAPVVIRIVNEPVKPRAEDRQLGPDRPDIPDEAERTPFDGVTSIYRALTAVRSGHEEGHAAYLKSVIGPATRLHEFNVYPLVEDARIALGPKRVAPRAANPACRHDVAQPATLGHVSMSWWMSQPVQAYLDAQWCVRANWVRLLCELEKDRTAASPECQERGD